MPWNDGRWPYFITQTNKFLTQENLVLKQKLQNKDKIITDFEQLFHQFKEKFIKLDKINQFLKSKLGNKNINLKEINMEYNHKEMMDSFNCTHKMVSCFQMKNSNTMIKSMDIISFLPAVFQELLILWEKFE